MNKVSYILGVILLIVGVTAALLVGSWLQTVGLVLMVAGLIAAFLGVFYPLKRKPSQISADADQPPQPVKSPPVPRQIDNALPPPQIPVVKDPVERLQDLKKLLDHKLITQEDYKRKKAEILSQV
jgi:hypothetical protein